MMNILNVVIGIVFVYLLFSLIVSAANEVIQSILDTRKKYLWYGIDELLRDRTSRSAGSDAWGPSKHFAHHPLIAALSKGADGLPSYIPAKLFATVLVDLIKTGMLGNDPDPEVSEKVKKLEESINEIKNPGLKRALTALWREAAGDLEAFKTNIEDWFKSAMDRVSGWYKRYTQPWLLALAMLFAVICNVDSIRIVQVLSIDPIVRQQLVTEAGRYIDSNKSTPAPSPRAASPASPTPAPSTSPTPTLASDLERLNTRVDELDSLSLPIGWNGPQFDYFSRQWIFVIVGWVLTALAGSLGAPFWFDTLNRVMNIRGTGKVPDQPKHGETAAKDGKTSST